MVLHGKNIILFVFWSIVLILQMWKQRAVVFIYIWLLFNILPYTFLRIVANLFLENEGIYAKF